MSTNPFQTSSLPSQAESKEDVARIREIIFGGQMREYEARFQMLEQSFRGEVNAMKSDLERHVGEVRGQLETEVSRFREELAAEMEERRRSLTELTEQSKAGFANVESALSSADTRLSEAEKRFNEGMIEKTQYIHGELQASVKSLTNYLDVQTRELKESKLDRADLSKALEFVAGGLAPKRAEEALKAGTAGLPGTRPL